MQFKTCRALYISKKYPNVIYTGESIYGVSLFLQDSYKFNIRMAIPWLFALHKPARNCLFCRRR